MVRTRFAPSPTGYLHIGGVRTALYCWLFSHHAQGGKFVLRIDDTDQQRNVETALSPILHGLSWVGLGWDEGPIVGGSCAPYFQSQRADRHRAAVADLLARGFAYKDYATTEEIQAQREAAKNSKVTFRYDRQWLAATHEDCVHFEAQGRVGVVRLKMPQDGALVLNDHVRGRVEFPWVNEQDHVVQRADGSCIYHLASVVDDHDFGITHVIRAEEHLSNTPRQVFIAQALGYDIPQYAHLPYVAEPGSKKKLSKRNIAQYLKNKEFLAMYEHGAGIAKTLGLPVSPETFNPVLVEFYEQVGYLPEALVNYLLLLGWSLDDKTEFLSRSEMVDKFTLERVGKGPASLDVKKLQAFQMHYMSLVPLDEKVNGCLKFLVKAGRVTEPVSPQICTTVTKIVAAAGDRIKVYGDILDLALPLMSPEVTWDEAAFQKRVAKPGVTDLLAKFAMGLSALEPYTATTIEGYLHGFLTNERIVAGDIVHAVRVATTGRTVGIGLYDCLDILGREVCVKRIGDACAKAKTP